MNTYLMYCRFQLLRGGFSFEEHQEEITFVKAYLEKKAKEPNGRVPSWISRRLIERGLDEPVPLRKLAGKYWVCGLGGGSCSTAELEDRLRRDPASVNITHGPFDREEDAQYAFDLMWESPE